MSDNREYSDSTVQPVKVSGWEDIDKTGNKKEVTVTEDPNSEKVALNTAILGDLVFLKDFDNVLFTYTDSTKTTLSTIRLRLGATIVRTWTYTEPSSTTELYTGTEP